MDDHRSRCKSADFLEYGDTDRSLEPLGHTKSLESGLNELKKDEASELYESLREEKDFIISKLKRESLIQEAEISRLKSIEASYFQTKQQLKDTKWMLKVKEEELKNVKADCTNNYNKRLEELVTRLNEKDVNLTTALNEKQDLMTLVADYSQRVDQLTEQGDYLQKEILSKNNQIALLEKQLKDLNDDQSKQSNSKEVNEDLQAAPEEARIENAELLRKIIVLEEEITTLQSQNSTLHNLVTDKEEKVQQVEELNAKDIQGLERELRKEKQNVAELVQLLEGVSTNSDHLPTGQVFQTINAPLDEYLLRRCESNNSIESVEDLQDDGNIHIVKSDFSESGISFKHQMNHTVENYEKQIKELQLLYDQDIFTLEKEKEDLNEQLKTLKEQCETANTSFKITTENAEEFENNCKTRMDELKNEYEGKLQEEMKNSKLNMSLLKKENEKLSKMLQSNEDEYMKIMVNVKEEILSRSYSDAQDKVQDLLDSQQHQVAEIHEELQTSLGKISEEYNNELLDLEKGVGEQSRECRDRLEDHFSDQLLDMQGKKSELERKLSALQDELNSIQTEYDSLKVIYDKTLQQLDEIQTENKNLSETLSKSRLVLISPEPVVGGQDFDALSISSNDVEIDSENYVNIEYAASPTGDQNIPLQEQLKNLRDNLNEAKNDVNAVKEEKMKFEILSKNLNRELNDLKSQLQNQSVFDMSKNFEGNHEALRFLETSIHELLSRSGVNIPDFDVGKKKNVLEYDSILEPDVDDMSMTDTENSVNNLNHVGKCVQDLPEQSILSTTPEGAATDDAKQLFNKIKFIFENAKAERDIICKQFKYLNGKFAEMMSTTMDQSQSDGKIAWSEIQEELLNQSLPGENSTFSEETEDDCNTFQDMQQSLMNVAEQLWQLFGRVQEKPTKKKNFSEHSMQCDLIQENEEETIGEATLEELKQNFDENLQHAQKHFAKVNQESLEMLKKDLEEEHNKLMKIMEDGLHRGYEESTMSSTKAHEEELSALQERQNQELTSLKKFLKLKEENSAFHEEKNEQLEESNEKLSQAIEEVEKEKLSLLKLLEEKEQVGAVESVELQEKEHNDLHENLNQQKDVDTVKDTYKDALQEQVVLLHEELEKMRDLNSHYQDEKLALQQMVGEKEEEIQQLTQFNDQKALSTGTMTDENLPIADGEASSIHDCQQQNENLEKVLTEKSNEINDLQERISELQKNLVESSHHKSVPSHEDDQCFMGGIKNDENESDQIALTQQIRALIKSYENAVAVNKQEPQQYQQSDEENKIDDEPTFLLEQTTLGFESQFEGLENSVFVEAGSRDISLLNSSMHQKEEAPFESDNVNTNLSLKALHRAFQNYHEKEMEQLKKESFTWLKNKLKDFETKTFEMQDSFESFHTKRISELHTEFVIKMACLSQQHHRKGESEEVENLAGVCVSQVLNASVQKDFESFYIDRISELHTDSAIRTAALAEQNLRNNEAESKVDALADNCVSDVLSESLQELLRDYRQGENLNNDSQAIQNAPVNSKAAERCGADHPFPYRTVLEEVDTPHVITGVESPSEEVTQSSGWHSNSLPGNSKSFTENDSPQVLVEYITSLESEITKLRVKKSTGHEGNPSDTKEHSLGMFPPKGNKPSGLKVRIQEDVVDKNALNQISIAKEDMSKQYQNLLNEFVVEHCKELEKLKSEGDGELQEHAKELAFVEDEHRKELKILEDAHGCKIKELEDEHKKEMKILEGTHGCKMEELEHEHKNEMKILDDTHGCKMEEFKLTHENEVEDLKLAHETEIGGSKQSFESEIGEVKNAMELLQSTSEAEKQQLQNNFEQQIENLDAKVSEITETLKRESRMTIENWKTDYEKQQSQLLDKHNESKLQELQESHNQDLLTLKENRSQELLTLQGNHEKEIEQLQVEIEILKRNMEKQQMLQQDRENKVDANQQRQQQLRQHIQQQQQQLQQANQHMENLQAEHNKMMEEKDNILTQLQTEFESFKEVSQSEKKNEPSSSKGEIDEIVMEMVQLTDVSSAPGVENADWLVNENEPSEHLDEDGSYKKGDGQVTQATMNQSIPTIEITDEDPPLQDVSIDITKEALDELMTSVSGRDTEKDIQTALLCDTMGIVLSAEQLIDRTLNEVIASQTEVFEVEEVNAYDEDNTTEEEKRQQKQHPVNIEQQEYDAEKLRVHLLPSLKDSCNQLHEAIEHILNMFMNGVVERKNIQAQYEDLALKYSSLAGESVKCEGDNKELVTALQGAITDQKTLERAFAQSEEAINLYKEDVENLNSQISNLQKENEQLEIEANAKSEEEVALNNALLLQKDEEIRTLQREKDTITKENESHSVKLEEYISELKNNLEEFSNNLDNLTEERRQLLQEKHDKCLQIAELKTMLEQEQYRQKETVEKALDDSLVMSDENTALLQDIENLNGALDKMTEERKVLVSALSGSGYSLEDIPKVLDDNTRLAVRVSDQQSQLVSMEHALDELLAEKRILGSGEQDTDSPTFFARTEHDDEKSNPSIDATGNEGEPLRTTIDAPGNIQNVASSEPLSISIDAPVNIQNDASAGDLTSITLNEDLKAQEDPFISSASSFALGSSPRSVGVASKLSQRDEEDDNKQKLPTSDTDTESMTTDRPKSYGGSEVTHSTNEVNAASVEDGLTPLSTPRFSLPHTPRTGNNVPLEEMLCKLLEDQLSNKPTTATPLNQLNPKVLLGEIQEDANELLELVLNYPEFYEPLSMARNFQNREKEWQEEKHAMLTVIKAWEELIARMKGNDRDSGDANSNQDKRDGDLPSLQGHQRRRSLIDALEDLFEQEHALKQFQMKDALDCSDDEKLSLFSAEIEQQSSAISQLVDKDRDYLIMEITNLHNALLSRASDQQELSQENEELNRDVELLREELNGNSDEHQEMAEKMEKRDRELAMLTELYDKANGHCERLKNSMEAHLKENKRLSNEKEQLATQLSNLERELRDAKEASLAADTQTQALLESARHNLKVESDRHDHLEQKLEILTEENDSLRSLLEKEKQQQRKNTSVISNNDQSVTENEILSEKLNNEKGARQAVERTLEDAMTALERERQTKNIFTDQLAVKENELEHLRPLKNQLSRLREELEKETSMQKSLDDMNSLLDAENQRLKDNLVKLRDDIEKVKLENLNMQNSLNDANTLYEAEKMRLLQMQAEMSDNLVDANKMNFLEDEVVNLRILLTKLNNEIDEYQEREKEWLQQKGKLENSLTPLNNLIEDEKKKCKYLEERLTLLVEEKGAANQLLEIEKKKNNNVEEREENLVKNGKRLRKELESVKMEKSELENALRDISKVHEGEREKLQKLVIESVEKEAAKVKEKTDERKPDIFQQNEVNSLRSLLTKLNQEVEDYQAREKEWLEEKKALLNDIKTLSTSTTKESDKTSISDDGKKLIEAGWTIAKVQRLYLKYFRAESFRKALRYQKRYLTLRLKDSGNSEPESLNHGKTLNKTTVNPKARFKVVVLMVVAINRMKYLVRKYQRYLLKSSPCYQYKEKRGGSTERGQQSKTPESGATSAFHRNRSDDNLSKEFNMPNISAHAQSNRHENSSFGVNRGDNTFDFEKNKSHVSKPLRPFDSGDVLSITSEDYNSRSFNLNEIYKSQEKPRTPIADSTRVNYLTRDFSPREIHLTGERDSSINPVNSKASVHDNNNWNEKFSRTNQGLSLQTPTQTKEASPGTTPGDFLPKTRERSFNSMKEFSYTPSDRHRTDVTKVSTPPKSYPRPKLDIYHEADLVPTKLTDSNSGNNNSRSKRSDVPKQHARLNVNGNSQQELKGYMQKLEDLQKKLKKQSTDSRYR